MSGDDFFNLDPAVRSTGADESAAPWLFESGADGPGGGGTGFDSGPGGNGFELPVLRGQLFGTEADGAGGEPRGGGEEPPLTLSQLMAEPDADFAFDLSYGAASSLFPEDASLFPGKPPTGKRNDGSTEEEPRKGRGKSPSVSAEKSTKSGDRGDERTNAAETRRSANDGGGGDASIGKVGGDGGSKSDNDGSNKNGNNKRVKWSESIGGRSDKVPTPKGAAKSTSGRAKAPIKWFSSVAEYDSGAGSTDDAVARKNSSEKFAGIRGGGGGGGSGDSAVAASSHRFDGAPSAADTAIAGPSRHPHSAAAKPVGVRLETGSPSGKLPDVPLLVPTCLRQQRQPQGILRQPPRQQRPFSNRSGSKPPQQQQQQQQQQPKPPPRSSSLPRGTCPGSTTPFSKHSSNAAVRAPNPGGANLNRQPPESDAGSGAPHHLLRPVAATFDRVAAEVRPLLLLEKSLDDVIQHLDALDAKCDAKLEELTRKRQAYLDATKRMQNAFD